MLRHFAKKNRHFANSSHLPGPPAFAALELHWQQRRTRMQKEGDILPVRVWIPSPFVRSNLSGNEAIPLLQTGILRTLLDEKMFRKLRHIHDSMASFVFKLFFHGIKRRIRKAWPGCGITLQRIYLHHP
jgi:hypothetical protein